MNSKPSNPLPGNARVRVLLDGQPVELPGERYSINAIRCYLETLALERQRILFTFTVDSRVENSPTTDGQSQNPASVCVEGATVDLSEMPLRLIETALQQTLDARAQVEAAVSVVLINRGRQAREVWWELTRKLKDPLLTLCLLPDGLFGPDVGAASPIQLRRWQLQQLAAIIRDVDSVCWSVEPIALSNALERRVLPWLDALQSSITLLRDTTLAAQRAAVSRQSQPTTPAC